MYDFQTGDPALDTWMLLRQTWEAMSRAMEKEFRKVGATTAQVDVLSVLKNSPVPMSGAEIGRWLFREPQTIVGLLNRMERKGLIRRVRDPKNRKIVTIEITEKGEELYKEAAAIGLIERVMSSLSDKQRSHLMHRLRVLRATVLQEIGREVIRPPATVAHKSG